MNTTMVVLRLVHVVLGAAWAGAAFLFALFIVPAVRSSRSAGRGIMRELVNRKVGVYIPVIAGFTVLSGLVLYWRDSKMSAGSFAGSRMGITYGIGGLAAIVAVGVGGALIGRPSEELVKIGGQIDASPTPELERRETETQARLATGSRVAAIAILIAVIAMAIGRYV